MIRRFLSLATVLGAGLLAACDDAPQSTVLVMRPEGTWSLFGDATARGPLPLTVLGRAAEGASADDSFAVVARAIRGGITRRAVEVAPGEDFSPLPALRSAWLLDAGRSADPNRLCAAGSGAAMPGGEGGDAEAFRVLAAFCNGDKIESAVSGRIVPRPDSVTDKRLDRLLRQMARQVFSQ